MANKDVYRRKQGFGGTSMGVSSIIAILVILVLVVFAALSVTTSRADYILAEKTAAGMQAFYDADCAAEDMLEAVVEAAKSPGWETRLPDGCSVRSGAEGAGTGTGDAGAQTVAYTIPIDGNRELSVELSVDASGQVEKRLWRVVSSGEWEADGQMNLFVPK